MTLPLVEYDDLFVYAPSYLAWEAQGLHEGKALGTSREEDLVLLDLDQTMHSLVNPEQFGKQRKAGTTVGKRRLKDVQKRIEPELNAHVIRFQDGYTTESEFRKAMHKTMKAAWKDVFLAGVRASGVKGTGTGGSPGKPLVSLTDPHDEKWIRSAMQHEMRFLNGMIRAVVEHTWKMPLPRRIRMYVDALESFYDNARILGLPPLTKIHWIVPRKDSRVCHSCRYLAHHSPYSKKTLPTVPRSGLTICLTNCRDRLLLRMVDQDEALRLHQNSPTRGTHIRKLRKIKQQGHARGILPAALLKDPKGAPI